MKEIYTVDDKNVNRGEDYPFYPKFNTYVTMFGLKNKDTKRYGEIKVISDNDKNVTTAKYEKAGAIDDTIWETTQETIYCYPRKKNDPVSTTFKKDDNTLTVFNQDGKINPNIFVPDLVVSKVRFMVEDALEKILNKNKNVMIYAYEIQQCEYHLEVLKMYGVTYIKVESTVEKTLENILNIKNSKRSIYRKFRRKYTEWEDFYSGANPFKQQELKNLKKFIDKDEKNFLYPQRCHN